MMRRLLVVLAIVSVVVAGLFVYAAQPAAADLTHTWTSDTDFAGGTALSTQVVGTGAGASIQLSLNPQYNWIKMVPAVSPSPRQGAAMTYDERNGVVLAFGGETAAGLTNDLWRYSVPADTWTNITPTPSPAARWQAGFSYDPVLQKVVMFGGADGSGWRTDIWWLWVSNMTWQSVAPPPPTPRNLDSSPLVYDTVAQRHILAATNTGLGVLETWAYDAAANRWSNRNPGGDTLPATNGHSLTYDRNTHVVILFGGASGLTVYGDVYEYNYTANSWADTIPWVPNVTPNKRTNHGMVFGPGGAFDILYGGIDSTSTYQPGTWLLADFTHTWLQQSATEPGPRKYHALAWDSAFDRTVMFGGTLSDGSLTNETVIWGPGYSTTGTYQSATFDAGCPAPVWQNLFWNSTTPALTNVRFKLATSTSAGGPWTFTGPDGLPGTFYSVPGTAVWSGNNIPPQEYFQWRTYLSTGDPRVTPSMDDVSITYSCPVAHPYVVSTSPIQGATGVSQSANITVTFSATMDPATVSWTFSDLGVTFSPSWDTDFKVLTLSHSTPFSECADQTMEVAGEDQANHLNLTTGTAPNPWTFQTICVPPEILSTNPADTDVNVPLTADIVVTFSEPMNTSTVAWTLSGGITLTGSWDPAEAVLTLAHATDFAPCTVYTAEITAGHDKAGLPLGTGAPNPWSFTSVCPNPFIASTDPAAGATSVPVTAPIVVTFSKAMDNASVTYTFSEPTITFTASWNSPADTVLTLSHATPFVELTLYTMNITGGTDTGGLPLIPGAPNPWSFRAIGLNPEILSTVPANGDSSVDPTANIVVTFSEPMNTGTVTPTIVPTVGLAAGWNAPQNTILTLTHTTAFAQCTEYTVTIQGNDMQGLPLLPGIAPNPWTFNTTCAILGPGHLRVVLAQPDVQLSWDAVTGATQYKVYGTGNRFAAWPWTLRGTVIAPTTTYTAVGDGADHQTHYYIVRASDGTRDSPNSTMGVKVELAFPHSTVNTNIAWFSLPFNSPYARASDIATALTSAKVDVVGKWIPAQQRSVVYYYARGQWRGTDFPIAAGDGLFLGMRQAFTWNVTGTDANVRLTFTFNGPPARNVNWISVPWTGIYQRASDIAIELGSSRVTELGLWDATTQTTTRWYWTGSAWTGTDFAIAPGSGVYLIIASSFFWDPTLVTPAVP